MEVIDDTTKASGQVLPDDFANWPQWKKLEHERSQTLNAEPVWRQAAEWSELAGLRESVVQEELRRKTDAALVESTSQNLYQEKKKILAEKIREALVSDGGSETETAQKANDLIFEELVVKENQAYLAALKANRETTLVDKAKESLRELVASKAVQWYVRQNKWLRLGVMSTLAAGVGYGVGALSAAAVVSYGAARIARGAASFGGAAAMNKYLQTKSEWSLDTINEQEKQEIESLKNSDLSLAEKAEKLAELNAKFSEEKKAAILKKGLLTALAGSAGGLALGLAENIQHLMHETTEATLAASPASSVDSPTVKLETGAIDPKVVLPEQIFSDPSALKYEVQPGDSVWKILQSTLEKNDQFKNLTEAQQTYVLSQLTNKVLETPRSVGFGRDGAVVVGQKLDLARFFDDQTQKETNFLFAEAKNKITEGSEQAKLILKNNALIAQYVAKHPDETLTAESVEKILSGEGVAEPMSAPAALEVPEPEPALQSIKTEQPVPEVIEAASAEQIQTELTAAKDRLAVLEKGRTGLRTMASDTSIATGVESAFRDEIDTIYGKKGWFGMGKMAGVASPKWQLVQNLPASKVLEYFNNPESSDLPEKVLAELRTSPQHRLLVEQVNGLLEEANKSGAADLKPYDNGETVENFIKRVGAFLMKQAPQNANG